jgi:hypothetical protein
MKGEYLYMADQLITSEQWKIAAQRLYKNIQRWEGTRSIFTKTYTLEFLLYPLKKRYENGERTEDLYHAIMTFAKEI